MAYKLKIGDFVFRSKDKPSGICMEFPFSDLNILRAPNFPKILFGGLTMEKGEVTYHFSGVKDRLKDQIIELFSQLKAGCVEYKPETDKLYWGKVMKDMVHTPQSRNKRKGLKKSSKH